MEKMIEIAKVPEEEKVTYVSFMLRGEFKEQIHNE